MQEDIRGRVRLRVAHAPRFGSDHSRLVLEIDTEEHFPPPVTSSEVLTMAEEDSPEADKFRVLNLKQAPPGLEARGRGVKVPVGEPEVG